MLGQLPPGRRINGIADFLGAGRSGCNPELCPQSRLLHQVPHHIFRHGTAANIAVAHEQYICHLLNILSKYFFPWYSTWIAP